MQTVEEIYATTIRPLSESDQRRLASLILEKVRTKNDSGAPVERNESSKIAGWWQGKEITEEEYLKLDHNERIDFDLAKSYADNHEDED